MEGDAGTNRLSRRDQVPADSRWSRKATVRSL
ncbi:hypothetical protein MT49_0637 [Mycobacterium tuberculosis 49-02]|nr:hypothetical protein MT49_0637 [Mycobacterium tuberculosis 49-02]